MSRRQRLDAELVRRRLVLSRTEAGRSIEAGRVLVNGAVADKPSRLVDPADAVVVQGAAGALRQPGRREARRRARCVRHRRHRLARPRRRRIDRRVHRLPAAAWRGTRGRRRRRPRPAAPDDTRRPARRRCSSASTSATLTTDAIGGEVDVVVADLSFISLVACHRRRSSACAARGDWCCSSSRSSRPAGRRSRGSGRDHRPGGPRAGPRRGGGGTASPHGCEVLGWIDSPLTRRRRQPRVPCACPRRSGRICTMTDVLLVAHHERTEAAALARRAATWLTEHGHDGVDDRARTPSRSTCVDLGRRAHAGVGRPGARASAATARCCAPCSCSTARRCPILGVNVGLLGYLTEVEPPALRPRSSASFAGAEAGAWRSRNG